MDPTQIMIAIAMLIMKSNALVFLNKIYKQQHPTTQTPAHFLKIIKNNPVFAR